MESYNNIDEWMAVSRVRDVKTLEELLDEANQHGFRSELLHNITLVYASYPLIFTAVEVGNLMFNRMIENYE